MPHILIVEDEAAIADTLIFALQGEGFTTTWLSLGAAALEHQRATPADLIILDIGLPDISGFETCKQRLNKVSSDTNRQLCCSMAMGLFIDQM
jgi:two-component system catabolic regulation response regulator CreB